LDELSIGIEENQERNNTHTTRLKEYMRNYSIGAILNLDIKAQTDGYILIGNKEEGAAFTENEVRYLRSILSNTSIAIERALLYNEVQSFNITLQERVERATGELKERNEELQDLYNNLEEIYQKEKDLMDVAGHEFRTPASILKNNLYLLKKRLQKVYPEKSDEKIETYIERLVEGTDRQIKLVNTFLESARIDNKRFEIQVDLVDIGELIGEAVDDMKPFAKKKSIQVIFHKPQKKIFVEIDTVRMREVVDNLLNNAVKYTDKGYIEITLTDKSDSIIFTVKDSGIGIRKQDQVHLFKKFSRVENYIGGETGDGAIVRPGGTGLGLYVARTIIDAHGGTIEVDSDIGRGSVFTFEIPKKQPSYVKRVGGTKTKLETEKMVGSASQN
jgi:signal transduction histidine kinase